MREMKGHNLRIYLNLPILTGELIYLTCPSETQLAQIRNAPSFILITVVFPKISTCPEARFTRRGQALEMM